MGRDSAVQLLDEIPAFQQSAVKLPSVVKDCRISPISLQHSDIDQVSSVKRMMFPE